MNQPLELTVVMYHYIRDPGDAAEAGSGILGMSVRDFETQLDALTQQHTLIAWPEVCMAIQEGNPLPPSACLLTFDDGVCDHYLNAFKVLRARGLSGLFFVLARDGVEGLTLAHKIHFLLAKLGVSKLREAVWERLDLSRRERFAQAEQGYRSKYSPQSPGRQVDVLKAVLQRDLSTEVDPLLGELFEAHVGSERAVAQNYYLQPEQIREMNAGGMHFGGHSRTHPWFDWIDSRQRSAEIRASADALRQIEPGPWAFAYPYGGLAEDAPRLLERHGFTAAFTTKAQLRHFNPYLIGRLDGEEIPLEGHHA